jgi:hypothetical protein
MEALKMSVTGVKTRPKGIFDSEMEFKDAGLIKAPAAATVDAEAKYVDVGSGLFKGCMMLDVSALEIADSDETYTIFVQGSNTTAFTAAGIVELASLNLGAKGPKVSDCDKDDGTGRYKIYFDNENALTYYRYIRIYIFVDGTVATGINFSAYCVPMQ